MPKNEEGEFELVLGNKQLLSMFFVVVVLLGVFFVMGYIVGRNSAPLLTAENARKAESKPPVVDSPAPKETPSPEAAPAPAVSKKEPAASEKPPAPAPPAPAQTAPPKPEVKVAPEPSPSGQPVPGETYLQLSATNNKTDADKMVDTLRKNGFPALVVPIPDKEGWVRVYVGPMSGADVNKMRDDLESKSFNGKGAIPKKF